MEIISLQNSLYNFPMFCYTLSTLPSPLSNHQKTQHSKISFKTSSNPLKMFLLIHFSSQPYQSFKLKFCLMIRYTLSCNSTNGPLVSEFLGSTFSFFSPGKHRLRPRSESSTPPKKRQINSAGAIRTNPTQKNKYRISSHSNCQSGYGYSY